VKRLSHFSILRVQRGSARLHALQVCGSSGARIGPARVHGNQRSYTSRRCAMRVMLMSFAVSSMT
jgi:hypothetical protein